MTAMELLKISARISATFLLLLCVSASVYYPKRTLNTALSSYINLEQQYALESEIITLMQMLKNEETQGKSETELDLNEIEIQVNKSKAIHRVVGVNLEEYLNHPFNAFHLIKRLYHQWLRIIVKISKNKIQHKGLRLKIDNLIESFPSEEDFIAIAWSLARLQYLSDLDLALLVNGTIKDKHSLEKPTVTDLFQISRMIFNEENFYSASQWLRETLKICKESGQKDNCSEEVLDNHTLNITNILSLLASSLVEMEQYEEAVNVFGEVVAVDPHNKRAQENKNFFEKKLKSKHNVPTKFERKFPEELQEAKYEKLCLKQIVQPVKKTSKLYCYFHPTQKVLTFAKADILSLKPRIILFHDFVNDNTTDSMKQLGMNQMKSMLEHNIYKYEMQGVSINTNIKLKKQIDLKKHFTNLKNLIFPPLEPGVIEIRNFGVQGFFVPLYDPVQSLGGQIGSFLVPLNDISEEEQLVFPFANVTTSMKKGSAIFWYARHLYPAVCPISHGSLWVASVGFFEGPADYCRMTEKRVWDLKRGQQKSKKQQLRELDNKDNNIMNDDKENNKNFNKKL
ncbi:prolyl 4-hydroxylase subunit alpha-1-like [Argonauta hians]